MMSNRMHWHTRLALLLTISWVALGDHRMITIGDRRLSIDCSGKALDAGTVILIAGGGTTAKHWEKVQPEVSSFSRVCSYDRAGFGKSDKATASPQSVSEVVDDLHGLLKASGEKGPFILVAHSIAGIYTRSFVTRFPGEVKGLILIDSSHEEQVLRLDELDPNGPGPDNLTARNGFFVRPGQRLNWRTELPLIVLGRGMPFPRTNRMELAAWDGIWREFQNDLARRSTHGEFRLAEKSGHFIQLDQPELVIQAIRDVSGTR